VKKPERLELEMEQLDAIVERARLALSDEDHRQLKAVITTLARLTQELEKKRTSINRLRDLLFGPRTEKTDAVLKKKQRVESGASNNKGEKKKSKGHGRNGAAAYKGAKRVSLKHESLLSGDPCAQSDCTGKVYPLKDPGVIVRIKGMPPLPATVYELEKLRCNLCNRVFTAKAPEDIGESKYDETAVALIALLKYGAGFPFNRLEQLERNFGIPLPASTQWELVNDAAKQLAPLFDWYIDAAAQGEVLHNDDTPMKILELMAENEARKETGEKQRTGIFTSGVIARCEENLIALFFSGRNHAGENLQRVLENRAEELTAPIQMCDALSRNLPAEFETLLSNCLSHGRRKFVEQVNNFPEECTYILEVLAEVYEHDAKAREARMSPEQRWLFHQQHSGPPMAELHTWFERQFDEKLVEPNSGLGQAISYMRNHWQALTLFLREPGAPLDNNIAERALKKTILHRKNALFYKTQNGARVGDLYMTLIHTAELARINTFDYLCELQRHADELKDSPGQWMPWNYRKTLQRIETEMDSAVPPE